MTNYDIEEKINSSVSMKQHKACKEKQKRTFRSKNYEKTKKDTNASNCKSNFILSQSEVSPMQEIPEQQESMSITRSKTQPSITQ